tara:strand:+ start:529 stop:651 length:123 start_codon:yes stop_codon:yes gene_type:complete
MIQVDTGMKELSPHPTDSKLAMMAINGTVILSIEKKESLI